MANKRDDWWFGPIRRHEVHRRFEGLLAAAFSDDPVTALEATSWLAGHLLARRWWLMLLAREAGASWQMIGETVAEAKGCGQLVLDDTRSAGEIARSFYEGEIAALEWLDEELSERSKVGHPAARARAALGRERGS